MELLIVLGLCFGAYELLGVFQGCFHYNEHPLPYQPQAHNLNSLNNSSNNDSKDNENDNDNEQSGSEKEDDNRIETIESRPKIRSSNDDEDEIVDNLKSGPCSCYSTVNEDEFDDETRIILRNSLNRKVKRQRKPINKFSLSTSLMSLSRDDSSFLFNYIDGNSNNKFQKFKSDIEISETSFKDSNYNENSYNDNRINRNCREHFDVSSSDLAETTTDNNEDISCNTSVNLDTNKKKIFFISAAS
ncbi:unnamed protein product [Chironomus riparius]|uniref:Uncharacterized protein n=1 Tax=Chironomus riparius TaxID=315576 RepID=A0A9N9RW11_9DIPT|nr:unnamed protein product [Chironomus riparius]